MNRVIVSCQCGHVLGKFTPFDDHGGVIMQCPACDKDVSIHNAVLLDRTRHYRIGPGETGIVAQYIE